MNILVSVHFADAQTQLATGELNKKREECFIAGQWPPLTISLFDSTISTAPKKSHYSIFKDQNPKMNEWTMVNDQKYPQGNHV